MTIYKPLMEVHVLDPDYKNVKIYYTDCTISFRIDHIRFFDEESKEYKNVLYKDISIICLSLKDSLI